MPEWVIDLIRQTNRVEPEEASILPLPVIAGATNRIDAIVTNALNRVATSTEGTRNENLNRAAFTIGGLLHTGTPNIEDARRVLYDAAVACGLAVEPDGDRSIRATIESVFNWWAEPTAHAHGEAWSPSATTIFQRKVARRSP